MAETKKCVICGKEFEGYGNNAEPVADGTCCDDCNLSIVVPARLSEARKANGVNNEEIEDVEFKEPDYLIEGQDRFIVAGKTITVEHKVDEEWLVENLRRCFKDFDVAYKCGPMQGLLALIHGEHGADEEFPAEESHIFAATYEIGKSKFDAYIEGAVVLKRMGLDEEGQRLYDFAHMFMSVFSLLLMNSKYAHRSAIKRFLNCTDGDISMSDKEYVADVMGIECKSVSSFNGLMELLHSLVEDDGDFNVLAVVKE